MGNHGLIPYGLLSLSGLLILGITLATPEFFEAELLRGAGIIAFWAGAIGMLFVVLHAKRWM